MQNPAEVNATDWKIIGVAVAAGVVTALQVGKVPPLLTAMRHDLGLSLVTAGWVASLFNGCGAALGIMAGMASDRIGARRVMLGCVALLGCGSLLGGSAATAALLLAGRFIEGIGYVGLVVAAPAIVVAVSRPADRRLALGIWGVYMPLGMALAMAATPGLLRIMSWRGIWLANGAILFMYLGLLFRSMQRFNWPRDPVKVKGPVKYDLKAALSSRGLWFLALCFALYTLQFFAVMTWLPTVLTEILGWSVAASAYTAALVVFVNVFGNLAAAWLMRCGVKGWALIGTAFAIMAATAVGIFSGHAGDSWRVAFAFLFSACGGLLPAAVLAGIPGMVRSPAQLSTANGVVVQGIACGSLAGPPVMAAAVGVFGGWQNVYWLLIVCCAAGALFSAGLKRLER